MNLDRATAIQSRSRSAAATRKGRRAAHGSVAREQMHCPKCDWPGVYIRTRYFETMTADVWMCDNSKCESYRLYWHDDKPLNDRAQRRPDNAAPSATKGNEYE